MVGGAGGWWGAGHAWGSGKEVGVTNHVLPVHVGGCGPDAERGGEGARETHVSRKIVMGARGAGWVWELMEGKRGGGGRARGRHTHLIKRRGA